MRSILFRLMLRHGARWIQLFQRNKFERIGEVESFLVDSPVICSVKYSITFEMANHWGHLSAKAFP